MRFAFEACSLYTSKPRYIKSFAVPVAPGLREACREAKPGSEGGSREREAPFSGVEMSLRIPPRFWPQNDDGHDEFAQIAIPVGAVYLTSWPRSTLTAERATCPTGLLPPNHPRQHNTPRSGTQNGHLLAPNLGGPDASLAGTGAEPRLTRACKGLGGVYVNPRRLLHGSACLPKRDRADRYPFDVAV